MQKQTYAVMLEQKYIAEYIHGNFILAVLWLVFFFFYSEREIVYPIQGISEWWGWTFLDLPIIVPSSRRGSRLFIVPITGWRVSARECDEDLAMMWRIWILPITTLRRLGCMHWILIHIRKLAFLNCQFPRRICAENIRYLAIDHLRLDGRERKGSHWVTQRHGKMTQTHKHTKDISLLRKSCFLKLGSAFTQKPRCLSGMGRMHHAPHHVPISHSPSTLPPRSPPCQFAWWGVQMPRPPLVDCSWRERWWGGHRSSPSLWEPFQRPNKQIPGFSWLKIAVFCQNYFCITCVRL